MPDADGYWGYCNDARARAANLYALRQGLGADAGRLEVETFLFAFRMFIESFCIMARYGVRTHGELSKERLKAYRPGDILDDLRHLVGVRFVGLSTFSATSDSHAADIGLEVRYGDTVTLDVRHIAAIHGRLGRFAHVTGTMPGEAQARALLEECFAVYAALAPLLRRHLLAVAAADRPEGALGDMTLLLGHDDEGRDWFIERRTPDQITVRLRPPFV